MNEAPEILLVEDNPHDEELTLHALKQHKLANRIQVVRDGAEALDYIFGNGQYAGQEQKTHPRVVLLDLKLPKVDGLEVLKRLRTSRPSTLGSLRSSSTTRGWAFCSRPAYLPLPKM